MKSDVALLVCETVGRLLQHQSNEGVLVDARCLTTPLAYSSAAEPPCGIHHCVPTPSLYNCSTGTDVATLTTSYSAHCYRQHQYLHRRSWWPQQMKVRASDVLNVSAGAMEPTGSPKLSSLRRFQDRFRGSGNSRDSRERERRQEADADGGRRTADGDADAAAAAADLRQGRLSPRAHPGVARISALEPPAAALAHAQPIRQVNSLLSAAAEAKQFASMCSDLCISAAGKKPQRVRQRCSVHEGSVAGRHAGAM